MYYENFAKLCELNNVKAAQVSKGTGIATATLSTWKKGKYTPKNDKLQLIANFFSVPLSWITGDSLDKEIEKYGDAINEIEFQLRELTENRISQNNEEALLAKLIGCFNKMSIEDKDKLLDYAEYLASKDE